MAKVKRISHGRAIVGPGTLYAMLAKFEENHVICRIASEGRRKSYIITETGNDRLFVNLPIEPENLCHFANGIIDNHKV